MSYIFDVCFLAGVATLVYFPSIVLLPFIFLSAAALTTLSVRHIAGGLLGFVAPAFLIFMWYFWNGEEGIMLKLYPYYNSQAIFNVENIFLFRENIFLVSFGILILFAIWRIQKNFFKNATRIRIYQQVIFMLLGFSGLSLLFENEAGGYQFFMMSLPVSTMISYYFLAGKKPWWNELLLWLLLASIFWTHLSV
jgi:hypothetical protein